MNLTTCEGNQLIEATRLWFGRNGGEIQRTIKTVRVIHDQDDHINFKPKDFENHTPIEFDKK